MTNLQRRHRTLFLSANFHPRPTSGRAETRQKVPGPIKACEFARGTIIQLLGISSVALTSQSHNSQGEETMSFSGNSTSRRSFVKTMAGSAAAAAFAAPAILRGADPAEKADTATASSKDKLRLAFIG